MPSRRSTRSHSSLSLAVCAAMLAAGVASTASARDTQRLREVLPQLRSESVARAQARSRTRRRLRSEAREVEPAAYGVGDSREFWAWDLGVMPPGFRRVNATCRVVTDHSYLFVEQELVDDGKVSDQDVVVLDAAMHRRTPTYSIAPGKGILDIAFDSFGPPPDSLDGDPRVFFLVLRMDTFNGMGFDGYFNAFDQLTEEEAWGQYQQHSNEAEVLYLNGARGDISGAYMRGVLAHELTHLIEFGYDPEEYNWLSETIAEGAMQLSGYFTDNAHVRRYASKPQSPLVRETYANYGAGFLFSAFLRGRLGASALGATLRDAGHGTASVEGVAAQAGQPVDFASLHAEWASANLFAGLGRRIPEYRHPGLLVPRFAVHAEVPAEGGPVSGELPAWGYHFVKLAEGAYQLAGDGEGPGAPAVFELRYGHPPRRLEAGATLPDRGREGWLLVVGQGDASADPVAYQLELAGQ